MITCCVPNCRSGHRPTKAFPVLKVRSLFNFPTFGSPEFNDWVKAILRKNWTPGKNAKVCSDHFLPADFVGDTVISLDCGEQTIRRRKPKLAEGAIPSQFNGKNKTFGSFHDIPYILH